MSKKNTVEKFAIGAAIAGAIGFVVGLLTAPKSGKQTRQALKKKADKGVDELEQQMKELQAEFDKVVKAVKKEAGDKADNSRTKVGQAITASKIAKDKLAQIAEAVKSGESKDSELDNAIKDAKQALESLKDYLKK